MIAPELVAQVWPVFSAEARELLQAIREGVLALERDPARAEPLAVVRRSAHNLKGTGGSLGLDDVERLAREIEASLEGFEPARGVARGTVETILGALAALEEAVRRGEDALSRPG